jgi:hypothetical protein
MNHQIKQSFGLCLKLVFLQLGIHTIFTFFYLVVTEKVAPQTAPKHPLKGYKTVSGLKTSADSLFRRAQEKLL